MVKIRKLQINKTQEGIMVPIFNKEFLNDTLDCKYSYLTTMSANTTKGPIVHTKRTTIVTCLDSLSVKCFIDNTFKVFEFQSVEIPPNTPVEYINNSNKEITLFVLSDYCWKPNDDECIKYKSWEELLKEIR